MSVSLHARQAGACGGSFLSFLQWKLPGAFLAPGLDSSKTDRRHGVGLQKWGVSSCVRLDQLFCIHPVHVRESNPDDVFIQSHLPLVNTAHGQRHFWGCPIKEEGWDTCLHPHGHPWRSGCMRSLHTCEGKTLEHSGRREARCQPVKGCGVSLRASPGKLRLCGMWESGSQALWDAGGWLPGAAGLGDSPIVTSSPLASNATGPEA